jgi:hypothetical protein
MVLGGAAGVFVGSIAFGTRLLPQEVEAYYTPARNPDVVYDAWLYLLLLTGTACVAIMGFWAIARAASALIGAFVSKPGPESPVGPWVAAWILIWFSVLVWLAIWLGNGHDLQRSWLELATSLTGVAGVFLIAGGHAILIPRIQGGLPNWGWLLIGLGCLGALLLIAIVLIFLWPWAAALS